MYLLWLLVANAGIFWIEHVYRAGKYASFIEALPFIAIPILMGQVGLFYGFRQAPSLLFAGALFTLMNVMLRLVNTYRLGETLNYYNWLGVALLVASTILLKIK